MRFFSFFVIITLAIVTITQPVFVTKVLAQTFIYPDRHSSDKNDKMQQLDWFMPIYPSPTPIPSVPVASSPPSSVCGLLLGKSEPEILYAISPGPGDSIIEGGSIKAWYNDEWPITIGVGSITPWKGSNSHVANPNFGDESQKDKNNFPFYPALFLTDITTDVNNKSGDARNGGVPHKPTEIYGTWKALGNLDRYSSLLPPENNTNLPPGADAFPAMRNVMVERSHGKGEAVEGYSAEIIWPLASLGLTKGHTYRAEIILHDGDSFSDIADICVTLTY